MENINGAQGGVPEVDGAEGGANREDVMESMLEKIMQLSLNCRYRKRGCQRHHQEEMIGYQHHPQQWQVGNHTNHHYFKRFHFHRIMARTLTSIWSLIGGLA